MIGRLANQSPLLLRLISALVLAPVAIAAVWFGAPFLSLLTTLAGLLMAWEWVRLCHTGQAATEGQGIAGALLTGIVLLAIALSAFGHVILALVASVIGAAAVYAVAQREPRAEMGWLAAGTLWIAVPCALLLWLARFEDARIDDGGRAMLLWMLAVVWATDIGAYAFGRLIGGPRLAPRWSPRKTWAGLIGGAGCAALAGVAAARLLEVPAVLPVVLLSAGLAIVGQFGDLAESVAKRRFGVKDSSGLIPGHGGLLDRLDGLLAVIPAVALLSLIRGESVLAWR